MAMIFVGGSRDIFELPEPVIARIGAMIAAEHGVLVGDAPGADACPGIIPAHAGSTLLDQQ